jgi:hypothetical protein
MLDTHIFAENIRLLGGESNPFLNKTTEEYQKFKYDPQIQSLFSGPVKIIESVYSYSHSDNLTEYFDGRVIMPRMANEPPLSSSSSKRCLLNALNTDKNVVLSNLITASTPGEYIPATAPKEWAQTAVFFGAMCLPSICLEQLSASSIRVLIIESDPRDLAAGLAFKSLRTLIAEAKRLSVSLQIIFHHDPEVLRGILQETIVGFQPTYSFGLNIYKYPTCSPKLLSLVSWIKNPEGLSQIITGSLGSEVDEINQVLQAVVTGRIAGRRRLLRPSSSPHDLGSIVLVASGPSLDEAIPWLKKHGHNLQIVCAGSSLGVLVRNSIPVSACVFLERQSLVYETDIMELINEGYDLTGIPLIASMTIDPRIQALFKDVVFFHRPLSATLPLYAEEAFAKLLQSGPHSANAALEALLHIGYRDFFLIGCDFGSDDRNYPRSLQALGDSPRILNLPVKGRAGKTIFTSPEMYSASLFFANAAKTYGAKLSSTPSGVDFSSIDTSIMVLNDQTGQLFSNKEPVHKHWQHSPFGTYDSQQLHNRISQASFDLHMQIEALIDIVNSSSKWDSNLSRHADKVLTLDETGLTSTQVFVKRLCHYPLYITFQELHDSSRDSWHETKENALKNLTMIGDFYLSYFRLLQIIVTNWSAPSFDWSQVEELIISHL